MVKMILYSVKQIENGTQAGTVSLMNDKTAAWIGFHLVLH